MFSALKRFTSKGDVPVGSATVCRPPGHQTMSAHLQKRFAKGVHYNSKHILKQMKNC